MALYSKKLRSIEDLEREKKLLQKERVRIEEEGFLSVEGIFKNKGKEASGAASLLDLIPVSHPVADILIRFVKNKLSQKESNSQEDNTASRTKKKNSKGPLKSLAVEFIGGYLKWKAIELSYKGVRHLIKKRKEKKSGEL